MTRRLADLSPAVVFVIWGMLIALVFVIGHMRRAVDNLNAEVAHLNGTVSQLSGAQATTTAAVLRLVPPACDQRTVGLLAHDWRVERVALRLAFARRFARATGLTAREYRALPLRPCGEGK